MVTGKVRTRRQIEDFEGYEIDIDGSIYSLNIVYPEYGVCYRLKPRKDRAGYLTVHLSASGRIYTKFLHRLLAETFIANPQNKPFVNHKNGNKTDNRLSNLEFCTHRENVTDAYRLGLNSSAKQVIDTFTGQRFHSISQAAAHCKIPFSSCSDRLRRNDQSFRLKYL